MNSIRGPNLGTKLFILMSSAIVVIPAFSFYYLAEMEDFLVDGQSNAQLLAAEGISTLFNGRADLFYELPLSPEGYEQLYAHPLKNPVNIDGRDNDWADIAEYAVSYGSSLEEPLRNPFQLLIGEHNDQIYALLRVTDLYIVYRDRGILRLDASDHLRVTFTGIDGTVRRLVVTMTEPGVTSTYAVGEQWRYALDGVPENRVPGFMELTDYGYILEFRIPLNMLGSTRQFGLALVDVDNEASREISSVTGSLPSAGRDALGLVLLNSPEVINIVEGLRYAGAAVQVIDSQRRVRAEAGSYRARRLRAQDTEEQRGFSPLAYAMDLIFMYRDSRYTDPNLEDAVISASLAGEPGFTRRVSPEEGEVITAAHPIIDNDEVIGTVVLTQNTDVILELQRDAMARTISFSVIALVIFVGLILGFSARLARRIRKLGAEATAAIDAYGRLRTNQLLAETNAGDEIGDLARSISGMLARLHQHNQFLENMPRTLRHEINNPLNALSTSLQNLEFETSEAARTKYLEAARRGVNRIGMIVQNLADAASLEDALQSEELEVIDLQKLVSSYMNNCTALHPDRGFEYRGADHPVLARVSDFRIEQLLDKLVDNAVDFSNAGSVITLGVTTEGNRLTLFVTNLGETIPADKVDSVFDSMVSIREGSPDNRLHFGMGLYVVRVIAEHHGGSVTAANLLNGNGVTIRVVLPLYRAPAATSSDRARSTA